jgi:class 3 adenylate cyclase
MRTDAAIPNGRTNPQPGETSPTIPAPSDRAIAVRVPGIVKAVVRPARLLPHGGWHPLLDGRRPPPVTAAAGRLNAVTSRLRGATTPDSDLVVIVFTDVVSSSRLLARVGDDDAHRILDAFHGALAETVRRHGGRIVKWLGDGLMASFSSVAGALRCAAAMQLASRRPYGGQPVAIRVGINAGETLSTGTDFFGAAVVTAHRLCRAANPGQILSSGVVASLVAGRPEFTFAAVDRIVCGGPYPVEPCELRYTVPRSPWSSDESSRWWSSSDGAHPTPTVLAETPGVSTL